MKLVITLCLLFSTALIYAQDKKNETLKEEKVVAPKQTLTATDSTHNQTQTISISSRSSKDIPPKVELTKEEKIESLNNQIHSVENKIEVLETEDPEGNAVEIEEKKAYLIQLRQELETLEQQ